MSSEPQRDAQQGAAKGSSEREPLPFEPVKHRKQAEKKAEQNTAKKTPVTTTTASSGQRPQSSSATGIPEVVSRRMVKRMAFFSGIPTALGMSTFVVSYLIVSNDLFALPTYAVLLVSLAFFGLGVLGLSYGALSASWDEDGIGSRLGWTEFTTNWARMTAAWKQTRESNREATTNKKKS